MNYLLDSHALIWFLNGDKDLSSKARKAIESPGAINFISIVSLWEIAIKISLGRLNLKTPFAKSFYQLRRLIRNCRCQFIDIIFCTADFKFTLNYFVLFNVHRNSNSIAFYRVAST